MAPNYAYTIFYNLKNMIKVEIKQSLNLLRYLMGGGGLDFTLTFIMYGCDFGYEI